MMVAIGHRVSSIIKMDGSFDMSAYCYLIFLIFSHFYVGSMCLMRRLHLARSCVSSLDNSLSDKSFLMLSNHLRFGLPLLLFPGTSIAIIKSKNSFLVVPQKDCMILNWEYFIVLLHSLFHRLYCLFGCSAIIAFHFHSVCLK